MLLGYLTYFDSRQLASGTINLRLGAVRRLAHEVADCGLLSADLAAGIRRVKGVREPGLRLEDCGYGKSHKRYRRCIESPLPARSNTPRTVADAWPTAILRRSNRPGS